MTDELDDKLEAELNRITQDEPTPETGSAPAGGDAQPTQVDGEPKADGGEIEVAGRKYASLEEFKKAHDSLYREHSKVINEKKALEQRYEAFKKLDEAWKKDPQYYKALEKAAKDYWAAKKGGASDSEARRESGTQNVPKELLDRLNRYDQDLASVREWKAQQVREAAEKQVDSEVSTLKQKFGERATKEMFDAAFRRAHDMTMKTGEPYSLEDAFYWALGRSNDASLRATQEQLNRVRAEAKAGVGETSSVKPSSARGPADMGAAPDADYNAALDKAIAGMNLRD